PALGDEGIRLGALRDPVRGREGVRLVDRVVRRDVRVDLEGQARRRLPDVLELEEAAVLGQPLGGPRVGEALVDAEGIQLAAGLRGEHVSVLDVGAYLARGGDIQGHGRALALADGADVWCLQRLYGPAVW